MFAHPPPAKRHGDDEPEDHIRDGRGRGRHDVVAETWRHCPVVTLCGHLYWCVPLAGDASIVSLMGWMANRSDCPVCKAGISEENVIPVYGRGAEAADPRKQLQLQADGIPERPRGQRLDPERLRRQRIRPYGVWDASSSGLSSSPTLNIFPAFFGGPLGGPQQSPTHHPDGTPLSPVEARQQMQQAFLSRLLLIVGSLVLLCLLTF
ncbi:hypothetical protein P43SY_003494 [Pythium insidiosum]|uniref:RING-type E3 ubiquitin transferase n=1 Tax=Pythium insidiosum TaxID=114742 RepID=A0AAD5Q909_PYTIN|nr:hypothetical protein P43SY_003494 [Pythium insidiosum]